MILIVEPDLEYRLFLEWVLKAAGYDFAYIDKGQRPELIVADMSASYNMEKEIEDLARAACFKCIPLVLMSDDKGARVHSRLLGAATFIIKDHETRINLISEVNRLLRRPTSHPQ